MSVTPAEITPAPTQPPAAATATPEPTPATSAPEPTPITNPWENPDAAKAEIERLRKENGAARTNAKAQAAEDARKEVTQSIAKALGLVEDDASDPAKLTQSLTASQAEAKQARVELAVFRNATAAGGDPAALLDSSSFLASLDSIDPADSAAVKVAIEAAVAANSRLGAAPSEPRTPAPNPAAGSSASGSTAASQLTEADVKRLMAEGKHNEVNKAREEGRLNNLLGIK